MRMHPFLERIDRTDFAPPHGYVRKIAPGMVEATGPAGALGDLCDIACSADPKLGEGSTVVAEISAVHASGVVLIPLDQHVAIRPDARVKARPAGDRMPVGDEYAGPAVDALGRPIDAGPTVTATHFRPLVGQVPRPMERSGVPHIITTGIRAIDGILTLARGQRIGIFAASGVGKTSLMEQLASQMDCDRCILCLVGERGREVEAVWRKVSNRADAHRYTVVAATSDESAPLRVRSVSYALCLAEYWRSRGEHVVLMVDSMTRVAMALREVGLAGGAPPTVRAYTPNVFSALPRLVERCGATASGSITAVMTVLSETDDVDDPVVELMKSLLDGHIVLSRPLAEQGHFPAIDVTRSISRGSEQLVSPEQVKAMRDVIAQLSAYEDARVMIESGVYKMGTNTTVDRAIATRAEISNFLRQSTHDNSLFETTVRQLRTVTHA